MENNKNEVISAFAFKTGRMIEDLINNKVGDIREENEILQAKILEFYHLLDIAELTKSHGISPIHKIILDNYIKHFNINTATRGKIE